MRTLTSLVIAFCCLVSACKSEPRRHNGDRFNQLSLPAAIKISSDEIISNAAHFVDSAGFEKRFCFLFDSDAPSSSNRFAVYDLVNDSVIISGKAAHGRCNRDFLVGRKYSDAPGCGCTAVGKYRVGTSYTGRFGLAYKLYGLDSTNKNALRRSIVLHGHSCIPDADKKVLEICQSDGCPMVSPGFMQELHTFLRSTGKPVLLWIYRRQS